METKTYKNYRFRFMQAGQFLTECQIDKLNPRTSDYFTIRIIFDRSVESAEKRAVRIVDADSK